MYVLRNCYCKLFTIFFILLYVWYSVPNTSVTIRFTWWFDLHLCWRYFSYNRAPLRQSQIDPACPAPRPCWIVTAYSTWISSALSSTLLHPFAPWTIHTVAPPPAGLCLLSGHTSSMLMLPPAPWTQYHTPKTASSNDLMGEHHPFDLPGCSWPGITTTLEDTSLE